MTDDINEDAGGGKGGDLLPCPFCGGKAEPDQFSPSPPWEFRYICQDCGAWGPEEKEQPAARDAWNTRRPHSSGDL